MTQIASVEELADYLGQPIKYKRSYEGPKDWQYARLRTNPATLQADPPYIIADKARTCEVHDIVRLTDAILQKGIEVVVVPADEVEGFKWAFDGL